MDLANTNLNNNLHHRRLCEFAIEKASDNENIHYKKENINEVSFVPTLKLNKTIITILFIRLLFELM